MTTKKTLTNNKEGFFDVMQKVVDKAKTDDGVSHVFFIVVHGNEKPENEEKGIDIQFVHNVYDELSAASMINQISISLAQKAMMTETEETQH